MVDHIYGRTNIVTNKNRPHVFIAELQLYIDYLAEQIKEDFNTIQFEKRKKYFSTFHQNLLNGISYYRTLKAFQSGGGLSFIEELNRAELELTALNYQYEIEERKEGLNKSLVC